MVGGDESDPRGIDGGRVMVGIGHRLEIQPTSSGIE